MIKKTIHYCWFGKGTKPEKVHKCINSWKKFCPDFEIIEWNEENFDININLYVKQAYEVKKYAFVSDYARFWILDKFGGVYLDTDVELIKPIYEFLQYNVFAGFEDELNINPGLIIGAEKSHPFLKEILNDYTGEKFLLEDGKYNLYTIVQRTTKTLKSHGILLNGDSQLVGDIMIFSKEYFCPKDYISGYINITKNTVSIHHYDATWQSNWMKFKGIIKKIILKMVSRHETV
ncbi:glycosyl transferase [Clostridium butyricum]|uniref:glycosyltransferase family 32 protein n=1 Tax=Clostridium butyricum TaxID=1492 RepID=UPI00051AE6F4|nr:glycosyltransferase [Clostridium butyricum]QUF83025.1 glycosyl transferase [Clostridium butyricum]